MLHFAFLKRDAFFYFCRERHFVYMQKYNKMNVSIYTQKVAALFNFNTVSGHLITEKHYLI